VSSNPFIYNNKITENYGDGIIAWTYDDIRCDGRIKNNIISNNALHGVRCAGKNNFTKIIANT